MMIVMSKTLQTLLKTGHNVALVKLTLIPILIEYGVVVYSKRTPGAIHPEMVTATRYLLLLLLVSTPVCLMAGYVDMVLTLGPNCDLMVYTTFFLNYHDPRSGFNVFSSRIFIMYL